MPINLIDTLHLNKDIPNPEEKIITPQMLLLCSWRTVKEVSQLFGLLGTEASIQTNSSLDGLLTQEQVRYMHIVTHIYTHTRVREYSYVYSHAHERNCVCI
jgi:hypothetical protein